MPKLGHFAFDKKVIARGFTSIVYRDKKVAIKCIDQGILDEPGKKKMLANQLSIQWQLKQQPYMVEIKGQFYQNDCIYIVLEYCQSGDLKNKIKQKGKFVQAKAVSYMIDIMRGFQTLVRHNIIHRDLKPSNIMISKKGIKIGDFGFAYKQVGTNKTTVDEISLPSAGSPLYMAPQVLQDGRNSSHESDVWSLGVVFFQMLTGRLPFPAKNKQSLIKLIDKIVIRTIIPENISPRSKQFLLRTLKKDVTKRMTAQQMINYEFDQQILFNIQIHRQRKYQQQQQMRRKMQQNGITHDNRMSSQQKQYETAVENSHTHLHHTHTNNNTQNESKKQHHQQHIHVHHPTLKQFQPQKPHTPHHSNTVPQQLVTNKKQTNYRCTIPQSQSNNTKHNDNNSITSTEFDNNPHQGKNLLDPHDIKVDKFKRKSAEKNNHIQEVDINGLKNTNRDKHNNLNATKQQQQQKRQQQITMVLNKQSKSQQQTTNKSPSLLEQIKQYQPNSYILHKKPITTTLTTSKKTSQLTTNSIKQQHNQEVIKNNNKKQFQSLKHPILKPHKSDNHLEEQDPFTSQPTIHSTSELQQTRRINNHHKVHRQDSKISSTHSITNSDNNHDNTHKSSNHNHNNDHSHSQSPQQMKKQEIIQILLNQVDIIRFLSRIMHKIQELHHIHTSTEKHQRSLSHHSTSSSSNQSHSNSNKHHQQPSQQPIIYTQLKQLIYKTIQQIQKLQFLPDSLAYKFFRSQEFQQIKIILDTYKNKLDLVGVKTLQWKGVRPLEKQLEKQILLIYSAVKNKITLISNKHLENQSREIKKLNRKIQALDYLIVFRYDYLILQREQIFLNQPGHKNTHHHEKCSRIKQIIEERHSKAHQSGKNLEECCGELRKIENVMKKIKLI